MRGLLVIAICLAAANAFQWSDLKSFVQSEQQVSEQLDEIDAPVDIPEEYISDDEEPKKKDLNCAGVGCDGGGGDDDHHRPGKPRFYGDKEGPRFRTMRQYRGYDLRCYPPLNWVSTKNDVIDSKDFGGMFKRLLSYIKGNNDKKRRYSMKIPVTVGMKYNITDHKTKSGMSFYLGPDSRCPFCKPARPNDPKVFIRRSPLFCAYVRSFDGWVMSRSWTYYRQLYYLSADLKRDRKDDYYVKGLSVSAGYNAPWELFRRHNEVWRIFKCGKCQQSEMNSMEAMEAVISQVEGEDTQSFIP